MQQNGVQIILLCKAVKMLFLRKPVHTKTLKFYLVTEILNTSGPKMVKFCPLSKSYIFQHESKIFFQIFF